MNTTIRINGQDEALGAATIAALLEAKEIGADARGIAVALNGAVVPRAAWGDTRLSPGDAVEIVRALKHSEHRITGAAELLAGGT